MSYKIKINILQNKNKNSYKMQITFLQKKFSPKTNKLLSKCK